MNGRPGGGWLAIGPGQGGAGGGRGDARRAQNFHAGLQAVAASDALHGAASWEGSRMAGSG